MTPSADYAEVMKELLQLRSEVAIQREKERQKEGFDSVLQQMLAKQESKMSQQQDEFRDERRRNEERQGLLVAKMEKTQEEMRKEMREERQDLRNERLQAQARQDKLQERQDALVAKVLDLTSLVAHQKAEISELKDNTGSSPPHRHPHVVHDAAIAAEGDSDEGELIDIIEVDKKANSLMTALKQTLVDQRHAVDEEIQTNNTNNDDVIRSSEPEQDIIHHRRGGIIENETVPVLVPRILKTHTQLKKGRDGLIKQIAGEQHTSLKF